MILELNKLLPKSNRLPLLNQENADNFLKKIKNRDEGTFKEVMKTILSYKNEEITQEKVVTRFEELLSRYPDLLEEAYLFTDYKKINSANYKKNINNKNIYNNTNNPSSSNRNEKKNYSSIINNEKHNMIKYRDMNQSTPKIQASPDYLFFKSLKEIFSPNIYNIIIKLLHLYNEGILSQYEFTQMIEPYFSNQIDLYNIFKTLTYSKMMNRRQFAIFNRPMCEMDFSSIIYFFIL